MNLRQQLHRKPLYFHSGSGLNGPQGMTIMPNGSIFITNTQAHTVLMWHPGKLIFSSIEYSIAFLLK